MVDKRRNREMVRYSPARRWVIAYILWIKYYICSQQMHWLQSESYLYLKDFTAKYFWCSYVFLKMCQISVNQSVY